MTAKGIHQLFEDYPKAIVRTRLEKHLTLGITKYLFYYNPFGLQSGGLCEYTPERNYLSFGLKGIKPQGKLLSAIKQYLITLKLQGRI
jgi:hypothetical protein